MSDPQYNMTVQIFEEQKEYFEKPSTEKVFSFHHWINGYNYNF
jgi:hypothetical protein